ncbi:histidine--tRNA ligase [soil metagenome]
MAFFYYLCGKKDLMSKEKPSIPKGTRDFGPEVVVKRNYIFSVIRKTFEKFGFLPLETPTMENLAVLTGKYGEEGDQLIFKILNNGLHEKKEAEKEKLQEQWNKLLSQPFSSPALTERALRYDLTVPFARYVVMHRNEITFPFKRYQIQPVWRADRPQKGRYREFYQCDADVVGTRSLLCEAEIVLMIDEVLTTLGVEDFTIKVNHRWVLAGIAEIIGGKGREGEICVAIDKLDKIGREKVKDELREKGFGEKQLDRLDTVLLDREADKDLTDILIESHLRSFKNQFSHSLDTNSDASVIGLRGMEELEEMVSYVRRFGLNNDSFNKRLYFDPTLARGLSYYTGCIFEVKVNNVSIGSISGGGRYDNLTGAFGLPDVPGVGFSFGVDRLYDVMEELQLFPSGTQTITQVLLVNFDKDSETHALPVLRQLRQSGISAELYPEAAKLKKQLGYADQKHIPSVVLMGPEEIASGKLQLRDMHSGEQRHLTVEELIRELSQTPKT